MKRIVKNLLLVTITLALVMGSMTSCHFHDYADATCLAAAQCECGEIKGEPLGHKYAAATCTSPQKCERCGKYNGKALGHNYTGELSCTEEQVCSRCGKSSGTVLGHDYANATCTTPKTCNRCGVKTGTELGHSYSAATCTSPQLCLRCEESKGAPLGHDYAEATCESPKTCKQCGNTDGNPLGHKYADNVCIRCQQVDPDSLPVGLDELHLINSGDHYEYSKNQFTDTYGYTYNGAHIYGFWSDETISVHNLNKEYVEFSGCFVAGNDMRQTATIEIYVDDVLIHTISDYTRETGKHEFSIDVSNAMKLKIRIVGERNYEGGVQIALVNAELTK